MATDRPRYTVSVDDAMFEQIENFRFEHRFKTRSQATVELIRLGIEQLIQDKPELFHAVQDEPINLSEVEHQLISDYRAFNAEGQEKIRDYVADLKDNLKYKKHPESLMDQTA